MWKMNFVRTSVKFFKFCDKFIEIFSDKSMRYCLLWYECKSNNINLKRKQNKINKKINK